MVIIQNLLIVIFGLASIAGGLILIIQPNPVRAALGLLLSMASMGAIYLTIGANFVGWFQIIIYAGAIVILFLFAVMHFPVGKLRRDRIPSVRFFGIITVILLGVILFTNLSFLMDSDMLGLKIAPRSMNDALDIGNRFLTDWIYPFELISVLLLVGVVAAVHITRPYEESTGMEPDEESEIK